ncbi:40S ribosomal protein S26-1-like [Iris pallida]|uniref:40S ribosomal protein S26-1-like n=1 Tax=Iris pallida TaxID=29817 RepID=A0AAX6GEG2_IRIPA|nr:40S ribosomal protein S26-1-like [Iris pallida]KAJ6826883.1 40S ribosomal protein S26-1-like [Iris pallida]
MILPDLLKRPRQELEIPSVLDLFRQTIVGGDQRDFVTGPFSGNGDVKLYSGCISKRPHKLDFHVFPI